MVDFELVPGVNVHVLVTKQFKQTKLLLNFSRLQTRNNAAARNLLANILTTSSQLYPTQTALARHLAKLYGASVGAYVTRLGHAHTVRFKATFINEQFAPNLLDAVVQTMGELLFHPLADGTRFDVPTWQLQKTNLVATLQSWDDDKHFYALRQLEHLYYQTGSVMEVPSTGTKEQVAALSNEVTYAAYQTMLADDQVDIFVIGAVDPEQVATSLQKLPFKARPACLPANLFHNQPAEALKQLTEHQPLQQAHLNLAYRQPVYFGTADYPTALVMNGLLGGSPYSKLFVNVREKASLAYSISSSLRPFAGHLVIQAGIAAQQASAAQQLIEAQVQALAAGNFDVATLAKVKAGLLNQYLASQDDENYLLGRALAKTLLQQPTKLDYPAALAAVTPAQVAQLAAQLVPAAVYLLSGDE